MWPTITLGLKTIRGVRNTINNSSTTMSQLCLTAKLLSYVLYSDMMLVYFLYMNEIFCLHFIAYELGILAGIILGTWNHLPILESHYIKAVLGWIGQKHYRKAVYSIKQTEMQNASDMKWDIFSVWNIKHTPGPWLNKC